MKTSRALLWLASGALLWRWVLAMRTPVPSEDGATYLWMAQRFAAGDLCTPLEEVFPPLLSLACAPLLWCGMDATRAGQLIGCLCGALAVFPVAALAERLRPDAGVAAAALLATGSLLARNAAEVYTESPFLLLVATMLWAAAGSRWVLAGVLAGAASWLRSEAIVLPAVLLLGHGRAAWRSLPPFAVLFLAWPLWRGLCGFGFHPLPILPFHDARDDLPERGAILPNLLAVPGRFLEAFGPAAVLVLLAPARRGVALDAGAARERRSLWGLLVLDVVAIVSFVVRRRFFLSAAAAVLPLMAAGLVRLPRRIALVALAALCALGMFDAWHGVIAADRRAERLVGEYLADRLGPGQRIAGDMQRVFFFAGLRPPPPRHFAPAELVAQARDPAVAFVVLGSRRAGADAVRAALAGEFVPCALPAEVAPWAQARGMAVWMRK